jgi:hypothetical protein
MLFWLAVGVASGSLAVVLIGIGYLLGRAAAFREAQRALDPLERAIEARRVGEWGTVLGRDRSRSVGGAVMAKDVTVDLDLRAKEFGRMTIAGLIAFAESVGHELHIEFKKPAPLPGPKKGRVRP